MINIFEIAKSITGLSSETLFIIFSIIAVILYNNPFYDLKSMIITGIVLAIFDLYLKQMLLFNVKDNYYLFVINNIITIITVDILVTSIHDKNNPKLTFNNYINIAFACLFYETIVFKLYNYNNLCNKRLRHVTKSIIRLATIHILSTFLSNDDFDQRWFNFSFAQIFNFTLYNSIFEE